MQPQTTAAFRWPFAYAADGKRDLRLDWLRGYCLFMMIVDHIGGPSYLYALTGQAKFYISAAEAFYFISGLTLGMITARESFEVASRRILHRAWVLYRSAVLMTVGFGLLGVLTKLELWSRSELAQKNFLEFIASALMLKSGEHGSEILILYVVFMLVTPLALLALSTKRWWLVALASVLVYTVGQITGSTFGLPFAVYFNPIAWQPLFFGGLIVGYHRKEITAWFGQHTQLRLALESSVVTAAVLLLALYVTGHGLPESVLGSRDTQMLPLRLGIVALYLQAAFILVSWFWKPLHGGLGWLIETLGASSLWAFVTHFMVFVVVRNLPWVNDTTDRTLWQLLTVLAVWGSIKLNAWRLARDREREPLVMARVSS